METIITAATILSMYLSSAMNENATYCYNANIDNGRVNTMYVYNRDGNYLTAKLAYTYEYDDQDRLVKKEVMRWDAVRNEWVKDHCLELTYDVEGYEVSKRNWNRKDQAYEPAKEKAVYHYEFSQVMSVNYLRRQAIENGFESVDKMLVMNPAEDILLATAL
jgi:hypothetical protein